MQRSLLGSFSSPQLLANITQARHTYARKHKVVSKPDQTYLSIINVHCSVFGNRRVSLGASDVLCQVSLGSGQGGEL